MNRSLSRRTVLGAGAAAADAYTLGKQITFAQDASDKTGVDPAKWNPEEIKKIAGSLEVDTKADVAKVVPLDYAGESSYWYVGPTEATTELETGFDDEFWAGWASTYPGIPLVDGQSALNIGYNDLLDKVRTAAIRSASPAVCKMPILWGSEFAGRGQLQEIHLEDHGYTEENFWPGALKSERFDGKLYGMPTNNETMAFIWNASIFEAAGLDPEVGPKTWAEVVSFSNQIKDTTGKAGYGLVARVNAGNTPFRFMPMLWAYGSGALDEAEAEPTFQTIMINDVSWSASTSACLRHVRDRQVSSRLGPDQHTNGKSGSLYRR